MKIRTTITKVITIAITMAALVGADLLCGGRLLQSVKAQTGNDTVSLVSYASIGIVRDQMVRVTIGNPKESGGSLSLSFSFYLAHGSNSSNSVPVYESEWIKVPPKQFRSFDVAREDLKTEGEPETARAQMIVRVSMIAPAGSNEDDFPTSLEIIEDEVQDGNALQRDSKYRLVLLAAKRSKQIVPIGFIPDHRLRYSVLYPTEEGDQPVSVRAFVYDSYGNLLTQTDPVVLRPGESHAFDVYRNDLRVAGEERTGRLQVCGDIQVASLDGSVHPVKLAVSMELVDPTGRTMGGSSGNYFTGTVSVSADGFDD